MREQLLNDREYPFPSELSGRQFVRLERSVYDRLRNQLFSLWTYMMEQDIWEEAIEFIEDHSEDPTPFDIMPYDIPCIPE